MDLLGHIKVFIDIADHGSLAATSRARRMAASAITASLRRLEDHVGAKLIIRSTRRMALTAEGERFLSHCRNIVEELDEAIEQVADQGPLKGPIRLTSVNDFGRSQLPRLIDSFLALHPEVKFELSLSDDVDDLIERRFDLGIRTGPLSDSRLQSRLVLHSGRSVCASPSYWKRRGKPHDPNELVSHNCLVLSRRGNPQSVWNFSSGGFKTDIRVSGDRTADDGGLLRQWAIEGVGVILKSNYDIAFDVAAGRLDTALEQFGETDVNLYAVHAAGKKPLRRVQVFIEHLRQISAQADNDPG